MHRLSTSFVLGYHGCARSIAERLLRGEPFQPSSNAYDWLGPGIYFWESNPERGLEFAREVARRRGSREEEIDVVGAIIDLGMCCDLTTAVGIQWAKLAYDDLERNLAAKRENLPANSRDGLRRNLDCAVMIALHHILEDLKMPPIDTLRGVFIEGDPVYPGGGFYAKTHIQIVVRNPTCIKGVFRVARNQMSSL